MDNEPVWRKMSRKDLPNNGNQDFCDPRHIYISCCLLYMLSVSRSLLVCLFQLIFTLKRVVVSDRIIGFGSMEMYCTLARNTCVTLCQHYSVSSPSDCYLLLYFWRILFSIEFSLHLDVKI